MIVSGPYSVAQQCPLTPHDGGSALTFVAELAEDPTVEKLDELLQGMPDYDLSAGGRCGWTALAVAIDEKSLPLIRRILDLDPRLLNAVCRKDTVGLTPLARIAHSDDPDFAIEATKELISRGADVNLANEDGINPLFLSTLHATKERLTTFLYLNGGVIFGSANRENYHRRNIALITQRLEDLDRFKNSTLHFK